MVNTELDYLTKDFINDVTKLGYGVRCHNKQLHIYDSEADPYEYMLIEMLEEYALDTNLDIPCPKELFEMGVRYAKTPLNKRVK